MKRKSILRSVIAFAAFAVSAAAFILMQHPVGAAKKKVIDDAPLVGSTTLVISQVYGGGGATSGTPTYTKDYVELKNISSSPQTTNGLSLYYGSATGQFASSATNAFALPDATIAPGKYYLIELGAVGTVGNPITPTPDATSTNLSMSGTSGKIALVNASLAQNTCGATATPCTLPNSGIIDVVAYGTANNGEGGTAVAVLSTTTAAIRKNNGCTESDNNVNDFDVLPPTPRNSANAAQACSATPVRHVFDYDGDGKTDYTIVRNATGGSGGQALWYTRINGGSDLPVVRFGIAGSSDLLVGGDYDGDGKTDIVVWRPGAPGVAAFYILQSSNNTVRASAFGVTGDDPEVVGDYDGDGKADLAIYRAGANAGNQSTWWYQPSSGGAQVPINWGLNGDFPAPGDYDGDGKADFAIQRNGGGGQARFWIRYANGTLADTFLFGTPTDVIAPGDYDGDGKTDIAVVRGTGGTLLWAFHLSSGVPANPVVFGSSATDFPCQGDYDGDGKVEPAIFRPVVIPGITGFYSLTASGQAAFVPYGLNGDFPIARTNVH